MRASTNHCIQSCIMWIYLASLSGSPLAEHELEQPGVVLALTGLTEILGHSWLCYNLLQEEGN